MSANDRHLGCWGKIDWTIKIITLTICNVIILIIVLYPCDVKTIVSSEANFACLFCVFLELSPLAC